VIEADKNSTSKNHLPLKGMGTSAAACAGSHFLVHPFAIGLYCAVDQRCTGKDRQMQNP